MKAKVSYIWYAWLLACLLLASIPSAAAATIAGRGTLSGTVTAPRPFQAAQVYAHNLEKNIVFQVFTAGGNFKAVNLWPGTYDVWAEKKGFDAEVQKVEIRAGQDTAVNVAMRDVGERTLTGAAARAAAQQQPYEVLFPDEPGRELIEKSCIYCHSANFVSRAPKSREGWEQAIALMNGGAEELRYQGSLLPRSTFTEAEWTTMVDYLAKHFGPDVPPRTVQPVDVDLPLDEQVLSTAMFIEYRQANTPPFRRRQIQEPNLDNKGNVWFTERGNPSAIGRLDPRTGEVRNYMNPNPEGVPHGLTADMDGNIWWAGRYVYMARINPETGEIKEFPAENPSWYGHTPVLDSKGNIWATNVPGNKILRWDRATDTVTVIDNPIEGGRTYGMIMDPQDRFFYTNLHKCTVGMYDISKEEWAAFVSPSGEQCMTRRLGMTPDGIVWFSQDQAGKIGRIDPATGEVTEFPLPIQPSRPYDVWSDPEGTLWISDDGTTASIIKYEPETHKFTYYPTPQQADIPKMTMAHDGGLWYAPRSSPNAAVGVFYPDMSTMEESPLRNSWRLGW